MPEITWELGIIAGPNSGQAGIDVAACRISDKQWLWKRWCGRAGEWCVSRAETPEQTMNMHSAA